MTGRQLLERIVNEGSRKGKPDFVSPGKTCFLLTTLGAAVGIPITPAIIAAAEKDGTHDYSGSGICYWFEQEP